jgi:septal ring factor EnvC (AmiA/AmiB activator)
MNARNEEVAANPRVVVAWFPIREFAAIAALVLSTTGALTAGMQWAISNNVEPLFMELRSVRDDIRIIQGDIGELKAQGAESRTEIGTLRAEVAENRAEIAENRRQIVDLRERMARVETGLEQVQANQVRMLEILERGPPPGA